MKLSYSPSFFFTTAIISLSYCWLLFILVSHFPPKEGERAKTHDTNIKAFLHSGFIALAAGLSVGMGGLAAGYAIGIVGDYVSRCPL
jgi:hypothetical protein